MSQEIIISQDNLPAFMRQGAPVNNDDALAGLSLGGYPYIKLNGTRFMAVEGDKEVTIPLLELPVVVVAAVPALRKKWYAAKYNPNNVDPTKKPDCFSDDGLVPHGTSAHPQSKTCATCLHNAFGSGTDSDGKPTNGKACSDNKQLAVFSQAPSKYQGAGGVQIENTIFGLKLPPASLKNFAIYVKAMTAKGVPLGGALTCVGFDPEFTYPVLSFRFAGLLNDAQFAKIKQLSQSDEVQLILAPTPGAATPLAPVTPVVQPAAATVAPATVDDLGLGLTETVVVQPVVQMQASQAAPAQVVQAAAQPAAPDDMFGDLLGGSVVATQPATTAPMNSAIVMDENDDALAKELGLL